MLEFCSFHPGEAEFPNIQFKNSTLPMGEFPCCGELALRFQPLFQVCLIYQFPLSFKSIILYYVYVQSSNGCKVRDHKLRVRTATDSELYRTLMTHRDLICVRYLNICFPNSSQLISNQFLSQVIKEIYQTV